MNIAYLCGQDTHPQSPSRRTDAFEHDLMVDVFRKAFSRREWMLSETLWQTAPRSCHGYDAYLIGTCWDYTRQPDKFLATLAILEGKGRVLNAVDLVRWNHDKRYL